MEFDIYSVGIKESLRRHNWNIGYILVKQIGQRDNFNNTNNIHEGRGKNNMFMNM